jgi:hypothetical protein
MLGKCLSTVFLNIFYARRPVLVPSGYTKGVLSSISVKALNSDGNFLIGLNLGTKPKFRKSEKTSPSLKGAVENCLIDFLN